MQLRLIVPFALPEISQLSFFFMVQLDSMLIVVSRKPAVLLIISCKKSMMLDEGCSKFMLLQTIQALMTLAKGNNEGGEGRKWEGAQRE